MKYLLNIFDLDGTLIDSHEAICMALNDTLNHYGRESLDYSVLRKFIGYPFPPVLKGLGVSADNEEIMEIYRSFYFRYAGKYLRLYAGVREALGTLKNMVLLSVVTNKSRKGAAVSLESAGIAGYFDYMITEKDTPSMKPAPDAFEKIKVLYKHEGKIIGNEDAVMIGDSPVDCEFAANCGIDFAFAQWGFFDLKDLPCEPSCILKEPSGIIDMNGPGEIAEVEFTEELDLHAFSPKEVSRLVKSYLKKAREMGFHSVRIIHGKGIGVQREMVRKILSATPGISNFYDAPPDYGGRGATIAEF